MTEEPAITRPDWDCYYLEIARAVSRRGDCRRARHGAVLVNGNRLCAAGYNGSPAGGPSCLAGECPRGLLSYDELPTLSSYDAGPGSCIAVHAEANCLIYANRADCVGATLYITAAPCGACRKLIQAAGIERVVYS